MMDRGAIADTRPAAPPVYPSHGVPEWYRDAKLGVFVHWGLYAVPAWAVQHEPSGGTLPEQSYAHHSFAEWYANTVRIPGSPTALRHERIYGPGVSYEDFADQWDVRDFDADVFVRQLAGAGARYIVPTTKHHDGFCLWGTATTGFNAVARGPRRDLIAELHDAARREGLRFGAYFSGALDWHASDLAPIESDADLHRIRRNDASFSRYAGAQVDELVSRFAPDVLWNDIEWPDGGKGDEDYAVAAVLGRYFQRVPDGVVNDRWGVPYRGFLTREYIDVPDSIDEPWESTRGLGYSFGYNQEEDERHSLSGAALVRLLVDVVAKNGNLLINVGPTARGEIPEVQGRALRELGAWLGTNGDAVYGTRPWIRAKDERGAPQAYTSTEDSVYVHALDPACGRVALPPELHGATDARWADGSAASLASGAGSEVTVEIPSALRGAPAAVLRVTR